MNIIDFTKPLERANVAIPNKENGLKPDEFMNWWAVSASVNVHKIIADETIKYLLNKY